MTTRKEMRQDLAYWQECLKDESRKPHHAIAAARVESLTKALDPVQGKRRPIAIVHGGDVDATVFLNPSGSMTVQPTSSTKKSELLSVPYIEKIADGDPVAALRKRFAPEYLTFLDTSLNPPPAPEPLPKVRFTLTFEVPKHMVIETLHETVKVIDSYRPSAMKPGGMLAIYDDEGQIAGEWRLEETHG